MFEGTVLQINNEEALRKLIHKEFTGTGIRIISSTVVLEAIDIILGHPEISTILFFTPYEDIECSEIVEFFHAFRPLCHLILVVDKECSYESEAKSVTVIRMPFSLRELVRLCGRDGD